MLWHPLWHLASADDTKTTRRNLELLKEWSKDCFEISVWQVQGWETAGDRCSCPVLQEAGMQRSEALVPDSSVTCGWEPGSGPKDVRLLNCWKYCQVVLKGCARHSPEPVQGSITVLDPRSSDARLNMGVPLPAELSLSGFLISPSECSIHPQA